MTDQTETLHFEDIYKTYFDAIYRFVIRRITDIETAQDIVSETFLKVYTHLHTFKPQKDASISSWIYMIARNEIFQHYRKHKKTTITPLDNIPELADTDNMSDIYNSQQITEIVHHLLQELPKEDQEIILMKYFDELSNTDIATITKTNPNNTGVKIHRALQKFKTICLHHHISL